MSFEDHLDDPQLKQMHAYWRQKSGVRPMPSRRDIDPTELPRLLPHLLISEVLDGGQRFRYRLAGSAITQASGRNVTGCLVEDVVTGSYCDYINELHRRVCRTGRPLFADSPYDAGKRGRNFFAKRLLLPLSDDGVAVNQIISLLIFHFAPHRPALTVLEGEAPVAQAL